MCVMYVLALLLMLGIVKSNVMLTLFQVISRQFVLWGCIVGVPGVSVGGSLCVSGLMITVHAYCVLELIDIIQ